MKEVLQIIANYQELLVKLKKYKIKSAICKLNTKLKSAMKNKKGTTMLIINNKNFQG